MLLTRQLPTENYMTNVCIEINETIQRVDRFKDFMNDVHWDLFMKYG